MCPAAPASAHALRPCAASRRAVPRWPAPSADRTRPAAWASSRWDPTLIIPCCSSSRSASSSRPENWLVSADGLHVFATRQIIGHLLRNTDSTSQYVSCPGNNLPCTLTDPLTGITDNITLLQSQAKSWYDGLLVSVEHSPVKLGRVGYHYNVSYTLSKTFDYSDDDQLANNNADEQVDLVEGINNLRLEKGYSVTDERHRLTLYGEAELPWGFSVAPHLHFRLRRAGGYLPSRHRQHQRLQRLAPASAAAQRLGREINNSDQLNAVIDRWNALPACPAAFPCLAGGASPACARRHSTSPAPSARSICA